MELDLLVGDGVWRRDRGRPRVEVVELPGGDRSVSSRAGGNLDDAGRAEIRPREFLFARPDDPDRPPDRLRQAGRFDRGVPGVLAAVSRPGVGDLDADPCLRYMEDLRELLPNAEWALAPGPNVQESLLPIGDGGAGLERRVRDVFDGVCAGDFHEGGR